MRGGERTVLGEEEGWGSPLSAGRAGLLYSAEANIPTTGEFAGNGFRRTGEGVGTLEAAGGEARKAAKEEMAILANVEGFERGGEGC